MSYPKVEKCPICGYSVMQDEVDIGVGNLYSPAYCCDFKCGWTNEISEVIMKIGDSVKTPFGDPSNNRWRHGTLTGITHDGRNGLIRVTLKAFPGPKVVTIKRPMADIFLDD